MAMSDPVLAFLNSPLGIALGFAAGALLVSVVAIPVLWWRTRRERGRWRRQDALRRALSS
jgi:O-antigen/teichoic acid export membrane protein